MKIAYVASHIYRHTFEINEVIELTRQHPDVRIYSFYRPTGSEIQTERIKDLRAEIVNWSYASIARSAAHLLARHPIGFIKAGLLLAWRSLPNPVYWVKNAAVFFVSLPFLLDADRRGITHMHANFGSSPATVAWLGKHMLDLRMSITFHAFDIYSVNLTQRDPLKTCKLRDADLVIAVHEDGREYLRGLVPEVEEDKFKVIRICVAFEPVERPAQLPQPPLVLAAGNLVPKKGFDVLVEAVGILKRHGIPVALRILGEGPERPRLEALVRQQGIRDRVQLPGYFQHRSLGRHLAEATVFVAPSRVTPEGTRDGIPTVIIESWLADVPVVASLVGGMAEVIVDGETGLVFQPGNATGLAECLRRVITSDTLRDALATAGHRLAVEKFSPGKNVEKLLTEIGRRDHRLQRQPMTNESTV